MLLAAKSDGLITAKSAARMSFVMFFMLVLFFYFTTLVVFSDARKPPLFRWGLGEASLLFYYNLTSFKLFTLTLSSSSLQGRIEKLSFCSYFVRRFGIVHASMALRSLNHNLDHYILAFFLPNPQGKQKERSREALGIFTK